MEYIDRAVSAVKAAETAIRSQLQTLMLEAVTAEAYADVAAIAKIAEGLSFRSSPNGARPTPLPSDENLVSPNIKLLGADWPDSVRASASEELAALEKLRPRAGSRKDQYPRFLRERDRLVKVAWSKKERAPYEHRAPRDVVDALVEAIQKHKGENKLFQASDILPLKNRMHEEYPSYQSYLALNWLRDVGVIRKKGREGYVLRPSAATKERLAHLWAALPVGSAD